MCTSKAGGGSARTSRRLQRTEDQRARRTLIGPFAVEGSTARPPCVISTSPAATRRRAARRAGSMSGRQASSSASPCAAATARAASLGQIVASAARPASRLRMLASSSRSTGRTPRERQASLHQRTFCQSRAHCARHSMRRPHEPQTFSSRALSLARSPRCLPTSRVSRAWPNVRRASRPRRPAPSRAARERLSVGSLRRLLVAKRRKLTTPGA